MRGRAIVQVVSRRLLHRGGPGSSRGQVMLELWWAKFRRLLHIHHHVSSGAGTIGQLVADVPSGLLEVSGQLHAPAALPPGKELPVPTGWATEPVSTT
jgi:hypothetical protein